MGVDASEYLPKAAVIHFPGVLFKSVDPSGGIVKKHKSHPIAIAAGLNNCQVTFSRIREPNLVHGPNALKNFFCQVNIEWSVIHGDTGTVFGVLGMCTLSREGAFG